MGQQCCTDNKVDRKVYDPKIDRPEKVRNSGYAVTHTSEEHYKTNNDKTYN